MYQRVALDIACRINQFRIARDLRAVRVGWHDAAGSGRMARAALLAAADPSNGQNPALSQLTAREGHLRLGGEVNYDAGRSHYEFL